MSVTAAPPVTDAQATAQTWVEGFAAGWLAPSSPEAFAEHFLTLLVQDVRLIQPLLATMVDHEAFEDGFVKPLPSSPPSPARRVPGRISCVCKCAAP
jgi:hypothetical protein